MKSIRMLFTLLVVMGGIYAVFCAYVYFFQEKIVFVPYREIVMTPDRVNLAYEDIYIEVADGERINAWYIPAKTTTDKTVLFCHGNAGNISRRLYTAQFLTDLGVNLLMFDYRGYGRSDGSPSEGNVYADAAAVYRWLVDEKGIQPEQLFIFGRSLGGTVAVEIASREDCAGLIVESSFTTAVELGRKLFPLVPIKLLTRYQFDSLSKMGHLTCPVLVIHSPDDQLVPYEMGRRLFERVRSPKQFIDLSGDHNDRDYYESESYIKALQQFFGIAGAA